MAKKSKKITFRSGKDANEMLERKLIKNFIVNGKLTTTEKKIKFLKQGVERLIGKAKKNTESAKNLVSKKISDKKVEALVYDFIVPAFKDKKTGFVKAIKLNVRQSDGSKISRLEWTVPVIMEKKAVVEKKKVETKKKSKMSVKKIKSTK
ncbi:MAG: L17 family ribosomal protein [Patescibacteria group bacterium]